MNFELFKNPSQDLIARAETLFVAMAFEACVREVVEPYQLKILEEEKYSYSEQWPRDNDWDDYVKELDHTWLMDDDDLKHYLKRCNEEQEKVGLKTETPEQCPLLVAEDLTRIAKQSLIEGLQPVTGVSLHKLLCAGLDAYDKYIELVLKWFAHFVDADKALAKYM